MTKLSHIPMQIQKWIASLTHLFFLILGLTGICLMYIHGNFGLGLTGIGSVPYEDTAEFNTQFNSDLNDIFLYMDYQDVFGADSSIDLSRRMLKMTFGPSETENFSLSSLISYLESMGYQLDDDFNCQKVSEPEDGIKSRRLRRMVGSGAAADLQLPFCQPKAQHIGGRGGRDHGHTASLLHSV